MNNRTIRGTSATSLVALVALSFTPLLVSETLRVAPGWAQTTAAPFPLPGEVPSGTTVTVDGASSMAAINQALKQQFEQRFPGTTVNLATNGTDQALQALRDGEVDVAAIGRSLTDAERAEGLSEVEVDRDKIAAIVSADNPFADSITAEQFAQIFRGEITNWSEVGGPDLPIRLIDRPESSDTRQAFRGYPVFQQAPFQTGTTADPVGEDSTDAVVEALGNDGIGFAIYDQVQNRPGIRAVPMHETPPSDPRYPFSQPRAYVYNAANPTEGARAFLGFAAAPDNQTLIEEADITAGADTAPAEPAASPEPVAASPLPAVEEAPASPEPTTLETSPASPETTAAAEGAVADRQGGFPWWLLLIPLLGIPLLLWLLNRKPKAAAIAPVAPVAPAVSETGQILLVPRNCKDGYAYWEVPSSDYDKFRRAGGRDLQLRLYDITDRDLNRQTANSVKTFSVNPADKDLHLPIPVDNRDYCVELGYMADHDRWLPIARSERVRVPACPPVGTPERETTTRPVGLATVGAAGAAAVAAGAVAARTVGDRQTQMGQILLVPRNCKDAYAYWEVPSARFEQAQQAGGQYLQLQLYDVTDINLDHQPPHRVQSFEVNAAQKDLHLPIPVDNRDYVVDLGYATDDDRWFSLARSASVRVPSCVSEGLPATGADLDARQMTGLGTVGKAAAGVVGVAMAAQPTTEQHTTLGTRPASQIVLIPRSSDDAYAYWEINSVERAAAKQAGGRSMQLRIYDATNINLDTTPALSVHTYPVAETDQDRHVPILVSDRDYLAEVGYTTDDNRWIRLARSLHVRIPAHG